MTWPSPWDGRGQGQGHALLWAPGKGLAILRPGAARGWELPNKGFPLLPRPERRRWFDFSPLIFLSAKGRWKTDLFTEPYCNSSGPLSWKRIFVKVTIKLSPSWILMDTPSLEFLPLKETNGGFARSGLRENGIQQWRGDTLCQNTVAPK